MAAESVHPAPCAERPKLQNIDFLRFVAANIVVLSHIGLWFPVAHVRGFEVASAHCAFRTAMAILWNGHAAVMLFFVVSGICINMPYSHHRPLNVAEFYVRRYLRIGPPLLVAYLFSWSVSGSWDFSALPVVWSLWCEAIYYLMYPALNVAIARVGFGPVFCLSCVACAGLSMTPDAGDGHAWLYGPLLTWIVFFPVWLSGLWISENADLALRLHAYCRTKGAAAIAGAVIFLLSILWTILRFHPHGGVKYPLDMLLAFSAVCAAFVFVMLQVDLSRSRKLQFLGRQGRWSYALYLVHFPTLYLVTSLMAELFGVHRLDQNQLVLASFGVLVAAYGLAIGFYKYVERPSHLWARQVGLRVRNAIPFTIRHSRTDAAEITIGAGPRQFHKQGAE